MTEVTRRERLRIETDREIRDHARSLLVAEGRDAVTLRAIARRLGITAPAIYRYYESREDLLRHLCNDVCQDLARELDTRLERVAATDYRGRVFTVCQAFRGWALTHPREFSLVFATHEEETGGRGQGDPVHDQFAVVFLRVVGTLLTEVGVRPRTTTAPDELAGDLAVNQRALLHTLAVEGIRVPADMLDLDTVYLLLRWWARMYGHIALEVFDRFPFAVSHADRLFESMLDELATEVGLGRQAD